MTPQIAVLDAGGQYCHLITRKVRELGVYADVAPSETPASALRGRKGIIISGGPSSVHDPASPTIDPALLAAGVPVLGICYGQQLMAHVLGGEVKKGDHGEYGSAQLEISHADGVLRGIAPHQQVWMSHFDTVARAPEGFEVLASTVTCSIAAIADAKRHLYAVQFHPEVAHTPCGPAILENFLFDICHCEKDWDPAGQVRAIEDRIRAVSGDRNIFFFVSGGVDSTVAYTLCQRALGADRVRATYVDTGLMREGETDFVREKFDELGARAFAVEDARAEFLSALASIVEPERKRHAIGEQFVRVQERILESEHYLDGHWILGQGTIYPDTIESGGSAKADLIKTHHNRVAGIQKLIDAGRIVEPLASFYKDEVRAIGVELGIPQALLDRHPFPGPGLAIRCLCSDSAEQAPEKIATKIGPQLRIGNESWVLPVRSVGVQGDARTYRAVLCLGEFPSQESYAGTLINQVARINRVVVSMFAEVPISEMRARPATLTAERLDSLRRADAIVRRVSKETGVDAQVWQFPVILIPFGTAAHPDSIVLRPVQSVDGMTANAFWMSPEAQRAIVEALRTSCGIAGIFYDLTHKPPGTIEWE